MEEKKTEKEKEEHIWGRKISYFREEKTGKKRKENIWRKKKIFGRRRKRRKINREVAKIQFMVLMILMLKKR